MKPTGDALTPEQLRAALILERFGTVPSGERKPAPKRRRLMEPLPVAPVEVRCIRTDDQESP
jgi:hypothetical protein